MSTLDDAATFANDPELSAPLTAGVVAAAVQVMSEDPSTAHHSRRVQLGYEVLRNPSHWVGTWAWLVSTNPTVVAKWVSGDREGAIGDFPFVISTVWDALAGTALDG